MSDCRGFPHSLLHQDGSREKGTKILAIPTRIGISVISYHLSAKGLGLWPRYANGHATRTAYALRAASLFHTPCSLFPVPYSLCCSCDRISSSIQSLE
ncbi:hypothetical protein [Moorena producens]|uniref:hypothetical protein n=1 Tax=Moorena producens TaxID=1155739 RepID=UPI003C77A161